MRIIIDTPSIYTLLLIAIFVIDDNNQEAPRPRRLHYLELAVNKNIPQREAPL